MIKNTVFLFFSLLALSNAYAQLVSQNDCVLNIKTHIKNNQADFKNCNLNDNDIDFLFDQFNKFPLKYPISTLSFANNQITSKGVATINEYIRHGDNFPALDLDKNQIDDEGALTLSTNNKLRALHLGFNPISKSGINAFIRKIKTSRLYLSGYEIEPESLKILMKNNSSWGALYTLSLNACHIGDSEIEILANNSNLNLEELFLANNKISVEGLDKLQRFKNLYLLDVSDNDISDEGAKVLALSKTIVYLKANDNHIGKEGLTALAKNASLTTLDVENNQLNDESILGLLNTAKLWSLNLDHNNLTDQGIIKISLIPTLVYLSLAHNRVGDKGAEALASNQNIQSLNLSYNNISDQGGLLLADNKHILNLNLKQNKLGDVTAYAFANKNYKILNYLNISCNPIHKRALDALKDNPAINYVESNQICDSL